MERVEVQPTYHLGGVSTLGNVASGTIYASKNVRARHSYCWMRLAVCEKFPEVPSLAGTRIQNGESLLDATKGVGKRIAPYITLRFELFDDESPRTCANFVRLCNGQSISKEPLRYCHQQISSSYRGTFFHKIIPSMCAQGGDITMRVNNGYNYHSSAGRGWFDDENKKRRHNEEGLLSMANNGPNSNGTQFFITTSNSQEKAFNGRHVCFGRVVEGYEAFRREVAPFGNVEGHPTRYVVVVDCGEGEVPPPVEGDEEEVGLQSGEQDGAQAATAAASEGDGAGGDGGDGAGQHLPQDGCGINGQKTGGRWGEGKVERPCLGYGIPGL